MADGATARGGVRQGEPAGLRLHGAKDGFGDVSFLYKYRFFTRNEKNGNAMLSAQLVASIPTGSYSNGSTDAAMRNALPP